MFLKQQSSWSNGTRYPILWLRRFHSPLEDHVFKSLLTAACSGLGTVLTIRDPTIAYSTDWGFASVRWIFVVFLAALVGSNFLSFELVVWAFLIGVVVLGAGMAYLFLTPGFGITTISDERPGDEVAEIIKGIRDGANKGASEPLVLKCAENDWQTVVATAVALCAAIVVDITDMSENMMWELEAAFRLKMPESIILVHGVREGESQEMPEAVKRMRHRAGVGLWERSPVFLFPLDKAKSTYRTGTPPSETLHWLLAGAIVRDRRVSA